MKQKIIKISDDFWNIRGSYKIKGLIDVGTHVSLVRRKNGKFIFLDSLTLDNHILKEIDKITNNGQDIEAVLNLHPFHTLHVDFMHKRFPGAKHYGTARHISKFPNLKWEALKTEDVELHQMFSPDLEFSVPRGVDFISDDQSVHFSSVIAYHRPSKTIHVDDTFMYISLPKIMNLVGLSDPISFHPTLAKVLEGRKGATDEFQKWTKELADDWSDAENMCAAHMSTFIGDKKKKGASIKTSILKALDKVQGKLDMHKKEFG